MAHQETKCPECGVQLVDRTAAGTAVRFCERCDGIWVDAPTFGELSRRRAQQARSEKEWPLSKESKSNSAPTDKVRYWPCPVYGVFMNRVNFARISGVILDVCKPHGVWFQRDELLRVVRFIRSGGLARSKRLRDDANNRGAAPPFCTAQQMPGPLYTAGPLYLMLDLAQIAMDIVWMLL